jgi:hypothetical protein
MALRNSSANPSLATAVATRQCGTSFSRLAGRRPWFTSDSVACIAVEPTCLSARQAALAASPLG